MGEWARESVLHFLSPCLDEINDHPGRHCQNDDRTHDAVCSAIHTHMGRQTDRQTHMANASKASLCVGCGVFLLPDREMSGP